MGYTHYFGIQLDRVTAEQIEQLQRDAELVYAGADAADITLVREYDQPGTRPSVDGGVLAFNGLGDDGHETFYFDPTPCVRPEKRRPAGDLYALARNDEKKRELAWEWIANEEIEKNSGERWSFCKTARKPYDAAVGATLIRAKLILGSAVDIGSDGNFDDVSEDYGCWEKCRALYRIVFDEDGPSPISPPD
jgi:hypothetical protein